MGPGGWVFKILSMLKLMLEPKCQVCVHEHNLSQVNDVFTPKPAKLYKRLYMYTYVYM